MVGGWMRGMWNGAKPGVDWSGSLGCGRGEREDKSINGVGGN